MNADGYLNANGDLIGFNMYAYCSNDPVMGYDPTGKWTFTISFALSLVLPGAGYSFNIGFSVDSEDMCAIQYSYSVPNDENTRYTAIGVGIGAGVSFQYTNFDSVNDLNGPAKYVGSSAVNAVLSEDNKLQGIKSSVGTSIGGDVHVNESYTGTVDKFKSLIKFFKDLTGWRKK